MSGLQNKKAVVTGVANQRSIAWAIAKKLITNGAEVAFAVESEKAVKKVQQLLQKLFEEKPDKSSEPTIIQCCNYNLSNDSENLSPSEALFNTISERWEKLDILIHSVAWTPALGLPLHEVKQQQFMNTMNVSVYSMIELARYALPLMQANGGSIVTLSYHGSQKVMPGYDVMGVAKAALESAVRYLAYDLGSKSIRVNAISAGPVKTLASSAMDHFNDKLEQCAQRSPLGCNITADDIADLCHFLVSDESKAITGGVHYVDTGLNILGA